MKRNALWPMLAAPRTALLAFAAGALLLLAPVLADAPSQSSAPSQAAPPRGAARATSRAVLQRKADALVDRYKITLSLQDMSFPVDTTGGAIDGAAASWDQLAPCLALFIDEFSIYPPSLIEKMKLQHVVLCKDLTFARQLRTGIPDFAHDTFYLDVLRGAEVRDYVRRTIHHELFHIVDFRDDGIVYGDDEWKLLNPAGFHYGRGGATVQDDNTQGLLTDKHPGFLTTYATSGVEEDKAETFSWMVVNPSVVAERIKADKVVAAKARRMMALVEKFCPDCDAAFWKSISQREEDLKAAEKKKGGR